MLLLDTEPSTAAELPVESQRAVYRLVASWPATASSACRKGRGSSFPRFSARFRMPKQALGESENFGSGDSSRMSDNEHTAASLRHSEVLSVKYRPGHAIPEFGERPDDRLEVCAASTREEPGHILSNNPGGAEASNEPVILPPERATVASQSLAVSCNAVVLAGESSTENIDCWWWFMCSTLTVAIAWDAPSSVCATSIAIPWPFADV